MAKNPNHRAYIQFSLYFGGVACCCRLPVAPNFMTKIILCTEDLLNLDLSIASNTIEAWLANRPQQLDLNLSFEIDYPRSADDPRELSEVPEVRLWFVRLDARYPWLPLVLDWQAGELARYVAMLIPHQFHRQEGIQYNPEALEIWVMHSVFLLNDWLRSLGIPDRSKVKFMAQMFGYELDEALFILLGN
jgi:hypothetical protein